MFIRFLLRFPIPRSYMLLVFSLFHGHDLYSGFHLGVKTNWFFTRSFALTSGYAVDLKTSCQFFIQSETKPKPIVARSRTFSRTSRQLHEITSRFDCRVLCIVYVLDAVLKTTFFILQRRSRCDVHIVLRPLCFTPTII